jgi:hypothetical protein
MSQVAVSSTLLTPLEAAKAVRRSLSAINRDRYHNTGLPYVRVAAKTIRYRREDIEEYLEKRRVAVSEAPVRG